MGWIDTLLEKVREESSRSFDQPRRQRFNPEAKLDTSQVVDAREEEPEWSGLLLKETGSKTKPNGDKHYFVKPAEEAQTVEDITKQVEADRNEVDLDKIGGDFPSPGSGYTPSDAPDLPSLDLGQVVKDSAGLVAKVPTIFDLAPKAVDWLDEKLSGLDVVQALRDHRGATLQGDPEYSDTTFDWFSKPEPKDQKSGRDTDREVKFDKLTRELFQPVDVDKLGVNEDPFEDRKPTITPTGAYIDLTKEEYSALAPQERIEVDRNTLERTISEEAPFVVEALNNPNIPPEELVGKLNEIFTPDEYVDFLKYMDKQPEVTDEMKRILGIKIGTNNG